MKYSHDPRESVKSDHRSSRILLIINIPLAIVGLASIVSSFFVPDPSRGYGLFVFGGIIGTGGGVFIWWSIYVRKLIADFNKYVRLLDGDPENSLVTLAGSIGQDTAKVKDRVQRMITRGYFPEHTRIDEKTNRILFGVAEPESSPVTVNCPCCGAENEVMKGKHAVCRYCGSEIEMNDEE